MTNGISAFAKLKLLIWKNCTLQKRNKRQVFFEIFAPVFVAALLMVLRGIMIPAMMKEKHYEEFPAEEVRPSNTKMEYRRSRVRRQDWSGIIPFSPNTKFVRDIVSDATSALRVTVYDREDKNNLDDLFSGRPKGFKNGAEMRNFLLNPMNANRSLCGIELNDNLGKSLAVPKDIKLTLHFPSELRTLPIRSHLFNWKTDETFPLYPVPGPRNPHSETGGIPNYSDEGFVPLAHLIFRNLANAINIDFPSVAFQRFPHPAYLHDDFVIIWKSIMPLVMIICFYNTCVNTVKAIALEKEQQLKEVMKVMGLDCWLHWVAWFIKSYMYIIISIVLIVLVLKGKWFSATDGSKFALITYTPWFSLFFFLMIYVATSICFAFMISVFFSKASTAATVAGLCWFLSFCPYTIITNNKSMLSLGLRLLTCLASNSAMGFGIGIIFDNEASSEGLLWSKMWTPVSSDDTLTMGHIIVMFVLDAILYLLIALYVEQVMPGEFGVAQPWNYCFKKEYWISFFGLRKAKKAVRSVPHVETVSNDPNTEPDPKNVKVGLQTFNLTKEFKKKVVVDHLNLKVFEGQITIILGHNGAGKTTTMSMLTGIITPTSGTAIVAGHDIRTDITGARSSLGVCPQQNVLFSDLTVEEHIKFYASLKGLSGKKLKSEIERYIKLLDLKDKRRNLSKTLSGGMKRRLGVGVALCGGSKVVILDEPSSGLDPASRKELWDLLQAEKKGRTIIMSTHFMDEAEVLGERVAVMAGGKIRAIGSPFFLKRQFSVGYRLTAATTGGAHNPVTELIQSYIPEATLVTNIGSELSYALPAEVSDKFVPLLRELETSHTKYGLTSFGISVGSLEAVFMKVGADAFETLDENDQMIFKELEANHRTDAKSTTVTNVDSKHDISQVEDGDPGFQYDRYTDYDLWKCQWIAMFKKRKVIALRSWLMLAFQIGIPVFFLLCSLVIDRGSDTLEDLPARDLTLSNGYIDSVVLVSYNDPSPKTKARVKMFKKYFERSPTLKVVDIGAEDMGEYYMKKAKARMGEVRKKIVGGVDFADSYLHIWYSNFGYHDQPVMMMLAYDAIAKADTKIINSLSLVNYPLPYSLDVKMKRIGSHEEQGFRLALNVGFSLSIVTSFYVMFYVKETITRSKLLQLTSGASPLMYWGTAFIWDFVCFFIITFSIALILLMFQETGFSTFGQMLRLILVFLVFSLAMLPLNYLLADCFTEPASGFSKMCFINFSTGFITFLLFQIIKLPILQLKDEGDLLNTIFILVPLFAVCTCFRRQYDGYAIVNFCKNLCGTDLTKYIPKNETCNLQSVCNLASKAPVLKPCCVPEDSFYDWEYPGVAQPLLYMILVSLILFTLLFIKEYKLFKNLKRICTKPPMIPHTSDKNEDSDVIAEKQKIATMSAAEFSDYVLVCRNMSKKYGKFVAVNRVSFSVGHGECFGLLGINGAGKTTTFQMLTGDIEMSHGEAWVVGYCINDEMEEVRRHMGYCPQFDALLDEMTGRETIELFAGLKGIPEEEREKLTLILSSKLGFIKHIDKLVMEYSGGNKRKLSAAVALLGNPEVVYLDEPTTGMDPLAKRQVWRAVAARQEGCVVLTSHSMEECEALCTRLAIMIKGKFRCLGSLQHLKNKFSQGYTLIVKLQNNPESTQTNWTGSRFSQVSQRQTGGTARVSPLSDLPRISSNPELSSASSPATSTSPQPTLTRTARISSLFSVADARAFHVFIVENFPLAQLKDSFQGLLTYYIPAAGIKYSKIFGLMEEARTAFDIEDYTITQTSLEQIFLQFSQENANTWYF